MTYQNRNGFTLIEFVIVSAIVMTLASASYIFFKPPDTKFAEIAAMNNFIQISKAASIGPQKDWYFGLHQNQMSACWSSPCTPDNSDLISLEGKPLKQSVDIDGNIDIHFFSWGVPESLPTLSLKNSAVSLNSYGFWEVL